MHSAGVHAAWSSARLGAHALAALTGRGAAVTELHRGSPTYPDGSFDLIPGGRDPNAPPPGDPKDPANKVPNFSTWTERIVSNDISRAKENNPIQCVNGIDDCPEPTDYVYIKENCVTNPVPIDRNISKLQV